MEIIVQGEPISKKRPRFARRGKFVTTYSEQETEEGRFLLEAKQQIKQAPMEGPLRVSCCFYMPRPKKHFGTGKNAGKLKDNAPIYHTSKPDIDNLKKFALDCLKGAAWGDDCQIVHIEAWKKYDEHPRTVMEIAGVEEG